VEGVYHVHRISETVHPNHDTRPPISLIGRVRNLENDDLSPDEITEISATNAERQAAGMRKCRGPELTPHARHA
jgi:hypothetical protein